MDASPVAVDGAGCFVDVDGMLPLPLLGVGLKLGLH